MTKYIIIKASCKYKKIDDPPCVNAYLEAILNWEGEYKTQWVINIGNILQLENIMEELKKDIIINKFIYEYHFHQYMWHLDDFKLSDLTGYGLIIIYDAYLE